MQTQNLFAYFCSFQNFQLTATAFWFLHLNADTVAFKNRPPTILFIIRSFLSHCWKLFSNQVIILLTDAWCYNMNWCSWIHRLKIDKQTFCAKKNQTKKTSQTEKLWDARVTVIMLNVFKMTLCFTKCLTALPQTP